MNERSPRDVSAVGLPTGQGRHLLLVDDEELVRQVAALQLERGGYRVTPAGGAREALALFAQDPGAFDAVVTDYTMPAMTGGDLARELLRVRPELPIVVMSGYTGEGGDSVQHCGARELLTKPFNAQALLEAVHRALAGVPR